MTMNVAEITTSSRCGSSSSSSNSSNSPSSNSRLLGRCNSAEPRVFHELRHEIHLVKFPEDEDKLRKQQRKLEKKMKKKTRQKSITITLPDGKKVKQRKSENESMTPCPLKLALKNTDKGDVYVRADGKIVRLVKKKEKKRKEKEQKKAFKAEMKRLRKEAELKAEEEEEQQRQAQLQQQQEEEAATLSWQEVEEQKERIFKEHWQGNKATQTDETKRLSYQEAKAVFVQTKKKTPAAAPLAVSEDEESTTSEYEEEADAEDVASVSSAPESALRDASTLTFGTYTTADTTQMTQSEAGDQDDEEEDGDEGDDQFPTTTDEEVQVFYVSVDEEGNIDDEDLPFVKRMSQKSIEILAKANEMKFQSLFIEKVSDLRGERFHAVNVPKHPTQSNDYKPKNGGRMPRRCRTDASAAREEQQSQRSSSEGGPAFRRNMTS